MADSILDRSDKEFIDFIIEIGEKELGNYDHSVENSSRFDVTCVRSESELDDT